MKTSKTPDKLAKNASKYRNWTEQQLQFLLDNYGKMPVTRIAKKIGKSVGSVFYILKKEGIQKTLRYWTEKELEFLRENYKEMDNREISHRLKRSIDSIQLKAASLGLSKGTFWTEEETERLAHMKEQGCSYEEMAEKLGRPEASIHNRLISKGLTKKIHRWAQEEYDLVKQMATCNQLYTYTDIAKEVDKDVDAVRSLCVYRGWNKTVKKSASIGTEQLHTILREIFPTAKIEPEHHVGEKLKLDLYLPQFDLGFEYDGIQHFEYCPAFHKSEEDFIQGQRRDRRKEELCEARGINLIRIRYDEEITEELVKQRIAEVGYGTGEFSKDAVLSYKERKERLQQEITERILAESADKIAQMFKSIPTKIPKPKGHKWPKRKIPSRPFPKKK